MTHIIFPEDKKDIRDKALLLRKAWGDPKDDLEERKKSWKSNCCEEDCLSATLKIDNHYQGFIFGKKCIHNKEFIERNIGYETFLEVLKKNGNYNPSELYRIQGLYIESPYRKLGYGEQLLNAFEAQVAKSKGKGILLDVDKDSTNLISWYKTQGYTEVLAYDRISKDKNHTTKKIIMIK